MKPLLLVVENDSGTRRLLDVFLRREAFEVDAVPTGTDALLLLERIDYAAVILDLLIPGRTGRDVLDLLAARRPEMLERIVVISSATEARLREVRGRYPGVAALRKPFDLTELLAAVRERAARHPMPSALDPVQTFIRESVTASAKAGLLAAVRGEALALVTSFGYPPALLEQHFPVPLDAQFPLCEAARTDCAIWVSTLPSASVAAYPLLDAVWREQGSLALAAIPIRAANAARGVAGWAFAEPHLFDQEQRARLMSIAATAARLI